jgi:C4-dicarboxylate transporter DctM subunit
MRALPALTIPAIILGGILGGIFSPTEAGVIAVIYTTILGAFFYRNLNLRSFGEALMSTAQVTGAAVIIVAISLVMGRILAFEEIPQKLVAVMSGVTTEPLLVFLIVVILLLVVGCVMDAVANMIILGPLLMPICTQLLDMQSFQYGIFLMYALLIGLLTPPVGLALFVVAPIAKVSAERISVAVLPLIAAMLVVLTLIAFFPAITMWLPTIAGYK